MKNKLIGLSALLLAGCTSMSADTPMGKATVDRFWTDASLTGSRDCSVLGNLPTEVITKLTFDQMFLLCSGSLTYSSVAGDPQLAAAIAGLASAAKAGATKAP